MHTQSTTAFARFIAIICALALQTSGLSAAETPTSFKSADKDAMAVFEPYIGRWISPPQEGQRGETQFSIDYNWFDKNHSVVKLLIMRRVVGEDEQQLQWEGFYGVHPVKGYIYYHGVNVAGISSLGGMIEFNLETGERINRAQGRAPSGDSVDVQDSFTVIDKDSWRSITKLKRGDGEWRTVSDTVYTRLKQ